MLVHKVGVVPLLGKIVRHWVQSEVFSKGKSNGGGSSKNNRSSDNNNNRSSLYLMIKGSLHHPRRSSWPDGGRPHPSWSCCRTCCTCS